MPCVPKSFEEFYFAHGSRQNQFLCHSYGIMYNLGLYICGARTYFFGSRPMCVGRITILGFVLFGRLWYGRFYISGLKVFSQFVHC